MVNRLPAGGEEKVPVQKYLADIDETRWGFIWGLDQTSFQTKPQTKKEDLCFRN